MTELGKRVSLFLKVFRYALIFIFLAGLIYQTLEFLFLYWTYPTVVDIQESSPTYVEVPAFTFCSTVGYYYAAMCEVFDKDNDACVDPKLQPEVVEGFCSARKDLCRINDTVAEDFKKVIFYGKLMEKNFVEKKDFDKFVVPLEDYFNCTIIYAGNKTDCNLDNVLGSFYTKSDLPQFCFSIYSLWGQPNRVREKIPKGATMRFKLNLNVSRIHHEKQVGDHLAEYPPPLYNPPADAAVQIGVHSPHFLFSPYQFGSTFQGGHNYEVRVKLIERHLLESPYQTNCTDYMKSWRERGGKAPINQLTFIQECRINITYEKLGCVPMTLDYPHEYKICKKCPDDDKNCIYVEAPNNCSSLSDSYNQPCNSMEYDVQKDVVPIREYKQVKTIWAHPSDAIRVVKPEHDCVGTRIWRTECSEIEIHVPFDQFEINNSTYNPKFESLELFSVIGGYMGMWLGISLLSIYDIIFDAIMFMRVSIIKKNNARKKAQKAKRAANKRPDLIRNTKHLRRDELYGTDYQNW